MERSITSSSFAINISLYKVQPSWAQRGAKISRNNGSGRLPLVIRADPILFIYIDNNSKVDKTKYRLK